MVFIDIIVKTALFFGEIPRVIFLLALTGVQQSPVRVERFSYSRDEIQLPPSTAMVQRRGCELGETAKGRNQLAVFKAGAKCLAGQRY
jgi:hypothetical protein